MSDNDLQSQVQTQQVYSHHYVHDFVDDDDLEQKQFSSLQSRAEHNRAMIEEEAHEVEQIANKAVKVVAEAEKYDLIIQEVVYNNGKHDITDKVLKILNAGAK